ncbi:hypothetical protein ABZ490_07095 [Streptomyces sp. NPDC005811]|uniref:hypothetical protein n=1 Tax=Streptomyces sp. NPDC005811 TaxID=3154565 RepID=UPI003411D0B9
MTSVRIWGPGVGAVVVLVATGAWARGSSAVDAGLWASVRPAIEERLVARSQGDGVGDSEPGLRARWFCTAKALDLREEGERRVRAGVDTMCVEYGVRDGALQECAGSHYPQVMRLERDGEGYRVVSQEEPPDGAGYAEWEEAHFSVFAESRLDGAVSSAGLESAARVHFGLGADSAVGDC